MLCRWTRPSSPLSTLATAKNTPAQSISMLAATSGRRGRRTCRVNTDPVAQQIGAPIAKMAPIRFSRPGPGAPIRNATPLKPTTRPTMTSAGSRRPKITRSSSAIQSGDVATSRAATPVGMYCSARMTPPLPPTRRAAPINSVARHWAARGRSPTVSPRRTARR